MIKTSTLTTLALSSSYTMNELKALYQKHGIDHINHEVISAKTLDDMWITTDMLKRWAASWLDGFVVVGDMEVVGEATRLGEL